MNLPKIGSFESLGILFTLLPGLITFVLLRALTARSRKLDATEAILHGLAYTLLVHAIWTLLKHMGSVIPTPDIVGLSFSAIGLGLLISWLTNAGIVYRGLRRLNFTQETSWPSIWETAFREFRSTKGEYAVFQFGDGRRLYGAIHGFSADQTDGHILLDRAKWIHGPEQEEQPGQLLIRASDVELVQFMPFVDGKTQSEVKPDSNAPAAEASAD